MSDTDCRECKNFWQELDVNAVGCKKEDNITEEMWDGDIKCPHFEQYKEEGY